MKRKKFIKQLMAVDISPRSAAAFAEWVALTGRGYLRTLGDVLNVRAYLISHTYRPDNAVKIKGMHQVLLPIPTELPRKLYESMKRERYKIATLDAMVGVMHGHSLPAVMNGKRSLGYTASICLADEIHTAAGGGQV